MESILAKISIMLVPALLAITAHEVSHGFVADHFGDPTPRLAGRLTLNPLRHLDPIGTICLLILGFGWARPVPVIFSNLRQPRRDMILVAIGGPAANFTLAILSALGLNLLARIEPYLGATVISKGMEPLLLMLGFSLYVNLLLGIFNLIPIPPLDGGRVLAGLLPPVAAARLSRLEPFGFLLVIALIFFTGLWERVLGPAIFALVRLLAGDQAGVVEAAMHFLFGT